MTKKESCKKNLLDKYFRKLETNNFKNNSEVIIFVIKSYTKAFDEILSSCEETEDYLDENKLEKEISLLDEAYKIKAEEYSEKATLKYFYEDSKKDADIDSELVFDIEKGINKIFLDLRDYYNMNGSLDNLEEEILEKYTSNFPFKDICRKILLSN